MRKLTAQMCRNLATIPSGFNFEGTTREDVTRKGRKADAGPDGKIPATVTETFVYIPYEFGVFEGNETPAELDALAKFLFGEEVGKETLKDDDDEPVFPKGTPYTWPVALTNAMKLAFLKAAFRERTPEGTGKLSAEDVQKITKWHVSDATRKATYMEQCNVFLAANDIPGLQSWLIKAWVDAGRPALD